MADEDDADEDDADESELGSSSQSDDERSRSSRESSSEDSSPDDTPPRHPQQRVRSPTIDRRRACSCSPPLRTAVAMPRLDVYLLPAQPAARRILVSPL